MMTKQQHIDYWVRTAEEDWLSVEALMKTKRYLEEIKNTGIEIIQNNIK